MAAHPSGQCKTPGCLKNQWVDGFCRTCAQYNNQKKLTMTMENVFGKLLEITDKLDNIESRLSDNQNKPTVIVKEIKEVKPPEKPKIESPSPKKDVDLPGRFIPPQTHHLKQESAFIPSININNDASITENKETNTVNSDIQDSIQKLKNLKKGGL